MGTNCAKHTQWETMSENSRTIFANAINRNYTFIKSSVRLQEALLELLRERAKLLEEIYVLFLQNHSAVVAKVPRDQLKKHQDLADAMDDMYVESLAAMRKRINTLEAEELANRHTARQIIMRTNEPKPVIDLRQALEENQQRMHQLHLDERELDRYESQDSEDEIQEQPRVANVVQRGPRTPSPEQRQRERDRDMRAEFQADRYRPSNFTCYLCNGFHPLNKCRQFLREGIDIRRSIVYRLGLCQNCFGYIKGNWHKCRYGPCKRCNRNQYHNSLLCFTQL